MEKNVVIIKIFPAVQFSSGVALCSGRRQQPV